VSDQPSDSPAKKSVSDLADISMTVSKGMPHAQRLVITGALLATSIAFIIAMLTLPHLDQALTVALFAFVLGIPFLVMAFMYLQVASNADVMKAINNSAGEVWLAGIHTLSYVAMIVGFCAVLWHFGPLVLLTLLLGIAAAAMLGSAMQIFY
jgi:hypothetical protein